ncbi:hypothetical protein DFQ29_003520, partial [Apophysomyces sp. BC1021]
GLDGGSDEGLTGRLNGELDGGQNGELDGRWNGGIEEKLEERLDRRLAEGLDGQLDELSYQNASAGADNTSHTTSTVPRTRSRSMLDVHSTIQQRGRSTSVDLDLEFDEEFLGALADDSRQRRQQRQRSSSSQPTSTSAMEIDNNTHVNPWQPTNPRSYPSIESLMSTRTSRPYLRVPLFKNKNARRAFEATLQELVEEHLVTNHDDYATVEHKNNVFHDHLYSLIAEYTRPTQRTTTDGLQQLDDEATITEQLRDPTVS